MAHIETERPSPLSNEQIRGGDRNFGVARALRSTHTSVFTLSAPKRLPFTPAQAPAGCMPGSSTISGTGSSSATKAQAHPWKVTVPSSLKVEADHAMDPGAARARNRCGVKVLVHHLVQRAKYRFGTIFGVLDKARVPFRRPFVRFCKDFDGLLAFAPLEQRNLVIVPKSTTSCEAMEVSASCPCKFSTAISSETGGQPPN